MRSVEKPDHRWVYRTENWKRVRLRVLNAQPLCVSCLEHGRTTAAREVDHIQPISAGGAPFALGNLQPLCTPCHSRKTRREAAPAPEVCPHGWRDCPECGIGLKHPRMAVRGGMEKKEKKGKKD